MCVDIVHAKRLYEYSGFFEFRYVLGRMLEKHSFYILSPA